MSERKKAIAAYIGDARKDLIDLLQSLEPKHLSLPTCNEEWCVKDVVAHLVDADGGLRRLADLISKGELRATPGRDMNEHNRKQVESRRGRSLQELLAEMAQGRVATLSFLEALEEGLLDRSGQLRAGVELTVEQIIRRIGDHDKLHSEDIRKAISG